jgi:peptidoglycan/xylan/chitin deacetylase (PgdA/CDA1 family)
MNARVSTGKRLAKHWARRAVVVAARSLGSGGSPRFSPGLRILTYHRITTDPGDPFAVSPTDFRRQAEQLAASGNAVALEAALEQMARAAGETPRIALTFDDGAADFYSEALPVLMRHRLPATVYVNPSRVGTPGFLSWSQLQQIVVAGIRVGSHSLEHLSLGALKMDEVRRQVQTSRQILQDRLGIEVSSLAYPYGTRRDFSPGVKQEVRRAGYRNACTAINGVNRDGADFLELRRTKIEQGDQPIFSWILGGCLDHWAFIDRHLSFIQRRYAPR